MSFGEEIRAFNEKVAGRLDDVFVGTVVAVKDSLTEGSTVTGAPGQPVDTENLKGSYQETFPEQYVGQVATNEEYARAIEEGQQDPYTLPSGKEVTPRPMRLLSAVGGFHSVKLTRANFDLLVGAVVREVVQ